MVQVPVIAVNVVGGVGITKFTCNILVKAVCITVPSGSPTYDYYIFDNLGNVMDGMVGIVGNKTITRDVVRIPSGSLEIINSTMDGKFNAQIYSELAPTQTVSR